MKHINEADQQWWSNKQPTRNITRPNKCYEENLLNKRSVLVLLNFSNNSFNIHTCIIHDWSPWNSPYHSGQKSLPKSRRKKYRNFYMNKENGKNNSMSKSKVTNMPQKRISPTRNRIILPQITCTKGTRRAAIDQNTFHPWIWFPFIKITFVLYIHICI